MLKSWCLLESNTDYIGTKQKSCKWLAIRSPICLIGVVVHALWWSRWVVRSTWPKFQKWIWQKQPQADRPILMGKGEIQRPRIDEKKNSHVACASELVKIRRKPQAWRRSYDVIHSSFSTPTCGGESDPHSLGEMVLANRFTYRDRFSRGLLKMM